MIAFPRVIVTGGRDLTDAGLVAFGLDGIRRLVGDFLLVHGGARGADTLANRWAVARGLPRPEIHKVDGSDWSRYRGYAGHRRNQAMVDAGALLLVSFPGGNGTRDCTTRALAAAIPVVKVELRFGAPAARLVVSP
ncbi:MAG: DUF2493 domain-containing protein [Hyphomicrobium sp.]|nr:DUF2493 domain-containing protein [Hyphomicrobium sp.]